MAGFARICLLLWGLYAGTDECEETPHLCGPHAECANTARGFYCTCKGGYTSSNGMRTFRALQATCLADWRGEEAAPDGMRRSPHFISQRGLPETRAKMATNTTPMKISGSGDTFLDSETSGPDMDISGLMESSSTDSTMTATVTSLTSQLMELRTPDQHTERSCNARLLSKPEDRSQLSHSSSPLLCLLQKCLSCSATKHLEKLSQNLGEVLSSASFWMSLPPTDKALIAESFLQEVEATILNLTDVSSAAQNSRLTLNMSHLAAELRTIRWNRSQPADREVLLINGNQLEVKIVRLVEMKAEGPLKIGFIVYNNMESLVSASFIDGSLRERHSTSLNSQVVTAVLGEAKSQRLPEPVELTLRHLAFKEDSQMICVYWKFNQNSSSWSQDGCRATVSNATHTTCTCNHLTSFALIMAIKAPEPVYDGVLVVLNYVLVTFSLACLLLAILTFLLCRSIQKATTVVHLHLSLCLFSAHLLFLVGVSRSGHRVLCSVIAALLHFLFLACFSWMCLEGIQLFLLVRNLRQVKYGSRQGVRRRYLLLLGYGAPAVVVAVAAGVFAEGYGSDTHCWLSRQKGFFWSFLGPVCLVIAVNCVLFVSILRILHSQLGGLNADVSKIKSTRMMTFKAAAHLFILGCTWALGLVQHVRVFEYLFVIVNAMQGPSIFLIHCLLNQQVRDEYRRCLHRTSKKRDTTVTLGSSIPLGTLTANPTEETTVIKDN
ncbi:adhesion G protein-coupled receptor E1-like isoform X2 [Polypterus senegalus]|uniref:adhesion G protein-coupled receptor E1-like isoform X2 n=1 Tax=Polypterus senegalus TaxID=55291 RepID=UPI0019654F20|nr:adhesion G protein-coupled receptor E1-like isoform X2 [Polypterus senegalus]